MVQKQKVLCLGAESLVAFVHKDHTEVSRRRAVPLAAEQPRAAGTGGTEELGKMGDARKRRGLETAIVMNVVDGRLENWETRRPGSTHAGEQLVAGGRRR